MAKASKKKKAVLLGLALDTDGIKRITTGPDFALIGGTEGTHAELTEKALKIKEKLSAKGKTLGTASSDELTDIVESLGMRRLGPSK